MACRELSRVHTSAKIRFTSVQWCNPAISSEVITHVCSHFVIAKQRQYRCKPQYIAKH